MKSYARGISVLLMLVLICTSVFSFGSIECSAASSSSLSGLKVAGYPKFPNVSQKYYIIFKEGYRDDRTEISFFNISDKNDDTYIKWDKGIDVCNAQIKDDVKYFLSSDGEWVKFEEYYGRVSNYCSELLKSNLDIYDSMGNVVVKATPVEYIKFSKKTYKAESGDVFSIKCTTNITGKIKYKSSNSKIVKINSKGKIQAKKKGTVTITATASNGKTSKCKVVVS